ncbi:hypothetical protein H0H92_009838 [Tricholoma furcatifolium]|nr:hypothetical protein H0H92_009838 [Tricholoma furcatifolium]
MLVLSTLRNVLSQAVTGQLHTAVLLTTAGQLVAAAADGRRAKDEIRVVVGLAMEVWQETHEQEFSMVDSEQLGRIVVVPVEEERAADENEGEERGDPLMLLALNSTAGVDWEELQVKVGWSPLSSLDVANIQQGKALANHLAQPLSKYREFLVVPRLILSTKSTTTPPPRT